jgi:dihydrofolate synthase / folylpolyglutamate synthase
MLTPILARIRATHPRHIDLSLQRLLRLLAALGAPQTRLPPVIHVAGTNGKGSTVAFLRAMAHTHGLRAHAFTSPPLLSWAECFVLHGQTIDSEALLRLAARVEAVNARQPLTEWEFLAACALLAFSETPADLVLLECGLGGRWDCTNVIDQPALSIITRIGLDHQEFLGDTLAQITAHKAGIIKPGCPVVVAPRQRAEVLDLLRGEASAQHAPMLVGDEDFHVEPGTAGWHLRAGALRLALPQPALAGAHQYDNAATALVAFQQVTGRLDPDAAAQALITTQWPGRLQRLTPAALPNGWRLWVDGAHNADGIAALTAAVGPWNRPLHIITGLSRSRPATLLAPLRALAHSVTTVPYSAPVPIAAPEDLAQALGGHVAVDLPDALSKIVSKYQQPSDILVCGSLYLVAAALAQWG